MYPITVRLLLVLLISPLVTSAASRAEEPILRVVNPLPDFRKMSVDEQPKAKLGDGRPSIELGRFDLSATSVRFDLGNEQLRFRHEATEDVRGFPDWERWRGSLHTDEEVLEGRIGHVLVLRHKTSGDWTGMFFVDDRFYRIIPPASRSSQVLTHSASAHDEGSWRSAPTGSLQRTHSKSIVEGSVDKPESQCMVAEDPHFRFPDEFADSPGRSPLHLRTLVIYTQEAQAAIARNGEWPLIADLLFPYEHHRLLAQEVTNWSFKLSNLPILLETTFLGLSSAQEKHIEKAWNQGQTTAECFWSMLATGKEDVFEEIHQARTLHEADLVVLIEDHNGRLGPSGQICDRKDEEANDAFALVHWHYAVDQLVFAHEIGHILGAGHHEDDTDNSAYSREYARGWCSRDPSGAWQTIMTKDSCQGGTRLPFWSGELPARNHTTHNNAKAIRERARMAQDFMPQRGFTVATPVDFCSEDD